MIDGLSLYELRLIRDALSNEVFRLVSLMQYQNAHNSAVLRDRIQQTMDDFQT